MTAHHNILLLNPSSFTSMVTPDGLLLKPLAGMTGLINSRLTCPWCFRYIFKDRKVDYLTKRDLTAASKYKDRHHPAPLTQKQKERRNLFGDRFDFFHEFINRIRTKAALQKIRRRINKLERVIGAPKRHRPGYGSFEYAIDSYYIEIDNKGIMRLIETEQGKVYGVRRTKDLDELLYWIFSNITLSMACKNKTGTNADGYDHRIQIFLKQEELLGKINDKWKEKKKTEYRQFFKQHPVDDIPGDGPSYCEALRKQVRSDAMERERR